jgi:hypothetical protein
LNLRDALSGSSIPALPFIWKLKNPFTFQLTQKVQALASFKSAIGALPVQQFAHRVCQLIAADSATAAHDLLDQQNLFNAKFSVTKSSLRYHSVHAILPSLLFHSKEMAAWPAKNARVIALLRGYLAEKWLAVALISQQLTKMTVICSCRERAAPKRYSKSDNSG